MFNLGSKITNMRYKWLLFDADNTLMDFDHASKEGMKATFQHFGLHFTEDNYKIYKRVNHQCWVEFEKGEISAETLRPKRFRLLFEWLNIKPAAPEAFSKFYLHQLSMLNTPYDGVEDLLNNLKKEYRLSIITNGLKECQRPNYNSRGWDKVFDSIIVSDEIGVQKPDQAFFENAWNNINHNMKKSEALVIGDNLHSDIIGGQKFGLDTCWITRGRENESEIKPTYSINHVLELAELLK